MTPELLGQPESGKLGSLRLYLGYRFALAVAVLMLSASGSGPAVLGSHFPDLFAQTALAYFALSLLSLVFASLGLMRPATSCYAAIFIDIVSITLMTYASGGVQSGLGSLLAIAIALASLSLVGRTALLFAALATLAIITGEMYGRLTGAFADSAYSHAGMLGTSFFSLAWLAHELSSRIRRSEELAHQRGFDLANLAELNEYVIQQMRTGVLVIDEADNVRLMNDSAWYLLGMPAGVRRRPLTRASASLAQQLLNWRADPNAERADFRAVAGGRDLRATFTSIGQRGARGSLIFLEDTSEFTERAQQLKLASLGQLTASIAHEIRNPLGAISHAAQLLDESPQVAAPDRRLIEIIRNNTLRVNQTIENVLKLSKRQRREPKPLVLLPWLHNLLDDLKDTLGVKRDSILLDVDPEGTTVYADPGQLRQILAVLLDNAVKHHPGSQSRVRLQISAGISNDTGGPYVDVVDNGSGIPTEHVDKLFEPFFTLRHDGTGLGLYIARELSEANRIRLEFVPLPTTGSCFRLSFPDPRTRHRSP